jgi:hypothetical protein
LGKASRRKNRKGRQSPGRLWSGHDGPRTGSGETGKLSEALAALIEPYREDESDAAGLKSLVGLGAIAWNLAMFPESKRGAALSEMTKDLKGRDREVLNIVVAQLVRRKLELFPDDRRMIVSYEVTDSGGKYHLAVGSALAAPSVDSREA